MKKKLVDLTLLLYCIGWVALLLWFWALLPADGGMIYSILVFYIGLPLASFALNWIWGRWGSKLRFALPVFFGGMACLLDWLTFKLAITLSTNNGLHAPALFPLLAGAIPAAIGLVGGCIGRKHARELADSKQSAKNAKQSAKEAAAAPISPAPASTDAPAPQEEEGPAAQP